MISSELMEPPLYRGEEHIFDISFHPTADFIAYCDINGDVKILAYNNEEVAEAASLSYHKGSCRTVLYSPDGRYLFSGSKDKSIGIVDANGKLLQRMKRAHEFPVYTLYSINNDLLASGDDEGVIKIWDLRTCQEVYEVHEQDGSITGMTANAEMNLLCATSTDGNLGVYDLRKPNGSKEKLYALSDSTDEDFYSIAIVKDGKKVLCTSQEGVIYIYKWDWFGESADRIVGHPNAIDAMVKIDENTVITGSEDGYLRGVSIGPNKILSLLTPHSEGEEIEPITRISKSRDSNIIATISHDCAIKFHNIYQFLDKRRNTPIDPAEEIEEMEMNQEDENDFEDMEGDMEEDDDDDDDENMMQIIKPKEPKLPKKTSVKQRKKEIEKDTKKKFFSDM
jgi:WD40 repeat protein